MLRTLIVVMLVVFVCSVTLACSQEVYLKGVSHLKTSLTGQKFQATTTDGALASTKVAVGKSYSLMKMGDDGPYKVGNVVITIVRGHYMEGRLVTRT